MNNLLDDVIYTNLNDSVINYSQTIINILNERYGLNKKYEDLKDKNFRSIYKDFSDEDLKNIITSNYFWENVKISDKFKKFYNKFKNTYKWYVIEKNINERCTLRDDFIKNNIGIDVIYDYIDEFKENFLSIHINTDSNALLNSNARIKILLKNGYDKPWNKTVYNIEDLYILNDWEDLDSLIKYI